MRGALRPSVVFLSALLPLGAATIDTGTATATATSPAPDRRAAALDALLDDLHRRHLFAGAVALAGPDGFTWQQGLPGPAPPAPERITPDTPFDGGSLAKTFTAAAVLLLDREGRLDLDAPARRLLPELPYEAITLRHLIAHSSGLPSDYGFFDAHLPATAERTTEALLGVVAARQPALACPPGRCFEYNSLGYDLAALAAARAAGTTWPALVRERFLDPLALRSAFLRPARLADYPPPRLVAYRLVAGRREPHDVFEGEAFHGGSNLYLSAADLVRWAASVEGLAAREPRLVEWATVGGRPTGLTLGSWYRSADGRQLWYSGHHQGFHGEVLLDRASGVRVAYLSYNTLAPWLQKALVRALLAIARGQPAEDLQPPALARADAALLAGAWRVAGETVSVAPAPDGLLSVERGAVGYRAFPVDEGVFYVPGLDWMIGRLGDTLWVSTAIDTHQGVR